MSNEAHEQHDVSQRTRWPFGGLTLIALALLVYELTHSPALASVFVCIRFGWEDFLTGRWLKKNLPHDHRGEALSCLYIANGLWKITATAFVMSVAFALVVRWIAMPQPAPQVIQPLFSTYLTTIVAFLFASIFSFCALNEARRYGIRLWLDSAVHRARRHQFWPPTPFCEGSRNTFRDFIRVALFMTALAGFILFMWFAFVGNVGTAWGFFVFITASVFTAVCYEAITRKAEAHTPTECWPEPYSLPDL